MKKGRGMDVCIQYFDSTELWYIVGKNGTVKLNPAKRKVKGAYKNGRS